MPTFISRQLIRGLCWGEAGRALLIASLLLALGSATAQNPERGGTPQQQSGMSTGVARAPVKDALSRPITAGGFVDGAPVIFADITHVAGLDKFHHRSGTPEKTTILETPGSGVALIDYDNDGWLDIYLLNGSSFRALKGKEAPPRAMLLHNNHDGTFTDVTDKAGVANERWGFGVVVGDYDRDGWPDIYVSNFGKNHLYHNNDDGTFTDVSVLAGVSDPRGYYGLASAFVDVDDDGWLDLLVANDSVPKYLYRNKHDGTFEDVSYLSGFDILGRNRWLRADPAS